MTWGAGWGSGLQRLYPSTTFPLLKKPGNTRLLILPSPQLSLQRLTSSRSAVISLNEWGIHRLLGLPHCNHQMPMGETKLLIVHLDLEVTVSRLSRTRQQNASCRRPVSRYNVLPSRSR